VCGFRPDVWFGLRVLKAVQLMEIPLLKSWIHHAVMEGIVNAVVDPGKLDICGRRCTGLSSVVVPKKSNGVSFCHAVTNVCLSVSSCSKRITASVINTKVDTDVVHGSF